MSARWPSRLVGGALLAIGVSSIAHAQTTYTFTKIADTTTVPGLGGINCVGMNNLGVVIAHAGGGVWVGDGTSLTLAVPYGVNICPSINDSNELAYLRQLTPGSPPSTVLVRDSNGVLTTLASATGTPALDASSNNAYTIINNTGNVAFLTKHFPSSLDGVFVSPAGIAVYTPPSSGPGLSVSSVASINDSNVPAFLALGFGTGYSIFRGPVSTTSPTPLIHTGDLTSLGIMGITATRPVINNSDLVAFVGATAGIPNVYSTSDGVNVTLLGTGIIDRISLNDGGAVAYRRNTSGGSGAGEGLWLGKPGAINQKIIKNGDALDGSTFVLGFLWERSLNNRGQFAFWATLADGRHGVFRADPVDGIAPVVTAPTAISISATQLTGATGAASAALAAFLSGGTAVDDIDANPTRLAPQIGGVDVTNATVIPIGATNVVFRFKDASGNIGTATSQVTVISPERRVAGTGYLFPETPTYRATFSVDALGPFAPSGTVQYVYTRTRLTFVSTSVSAVNVAGTTLTIEGAGSVNGTPGYTFTATATDGATDAFGIVIRRPDGSTLVSTASQPLAGGALTVSVP